MLGVIMGKGFRTLALVSESNSYICLVLSVMMHYTTALGLHFFLYKMEIIIIPIIVPIPQS